MRPWKLAETNYGTVKQLKYEVAVVPFGATEPHNLHLPYGIDALEGDTIGERICEAAYGQGAKVVLLPTLPYGTQTNQMKFPLAMNLNPSTLGLVITDLVDSLVQHGILKIVLLNSHGGNELKPVLRELYGKTKAHLFLCNWYTVFDDVYDEIFQERTTTPGKWKPPLPWPTIRTSSPATPTGRSPRMKARRPRPASRRSTAAGSPSRGRGTC